MVYLRKYYAFLTAIFVFVVYLFTLAPSVVEIDSGELAAVQATLGIAHPTGYPLFTLLGHLFLQLHLPFSKIFVSNLLAALWCALGIWVFILFAKMILDNLALFSNFTQVHNKEEIKKKRKNRVVSEPLATPQLNETKKIMSVVIGGLILAFSKTYWAQSTSVEVYSLHLFLINLILFALLKAYVADGKPSDLKFWIFFALLLALGFSNHMTTLFILPAAAYLFFEKNKFNLVSVKKISIMLLCFFSLLIVVYLYLPLRAVQNPLFNWGNPISLESFFRHVSGKQFQVWFFSSAESAKTQFGNFIYSLPGEFAFVSILFCLVGIIAVLRSARKLFYFLLLLSLFTLFYSINYSIVDIAPYFLLIYITLSIFAVFGIITIFKLLKSNSGSYAIPALIFSTFILVQIYVNFRVVDQSNVFIFEDYSKSVINSTVENSIIFSYQWDYFISPSYYFQYVEGFRKDVVVIDKELLRRSWYPNQLIHNHPTVFRSVQSDITQFLEALAPFEKGKVYNAELIERLYRNLMTKLVTSNIDRHPFYIAPELVENEMTRGEFSLPKGYYLVPDIFLFKVTKSNEYIPARDPDFTIRFPKNRNHYTDFIENMIGSMLVRRALYEMQFDKISRAKIYINKIKHDLPHFQIPINLGEVFK